MRLAVASDIHGKWNYHNGTTPGEGWLSNDQYPQADVLLLAGDILQTYFGPRQRQREAMAQASEFIALDSYAGQLIQTGRYNHIIFVAGNHDFLFEQYARQDIRDMCKNITYLQDEEIVIDGVKFYGSPWQPWFWDWAFNFPDHNRNFFRARAHARMCWDSIPKDTNVLITHGPPHKILDKTRGQHVGCKWLAERLQHLMQLKLHAFGHIHPGYGKKKLGRTLFMNASVCNEKYEPVNPIQVTTI